MYNIHLFGQTLSMEVEKVNSNNLIKQTGEVCIVCEKQKEKGIHLYTSFICVDCEKEILATQTFDPKYKFYLEKLKRVNTPPLYS